MPQEDQEGTQVDRRALNEIIEDELPVEHGHDCIFIKVTLPCSMAKQVYLLLAEHGYGSAKMFPVTMG